MLTTSIFIAGLSAMLAAFAYATVRLPLSGVKQSGRVAARHPETTSNQTAADPLPPGWPHEAPAYPMSPAAAHEVMRGHRSCSSDVCARKAAAFDALVGSGAIRPRGTR